MGRMERTWHDLVAAVFAVLVLLVLVDNGVGSCGVVVPVYLRVIFVADEVSFDFHCVSGDAGRPVVSAVVKDYLGKHESRDSLNSGWYDL